MNQRRVIVVLVVGGLAAIAMWFWIARGHAPSTSATPASPIIELSSNSSARSDPPSANAQQGAASTVHNADRFAELSRATSQGNADAAYQLARGREACLRWSGMTHFYRMQEDSLRGIADAPDAGENRTEASKQLDETRQQLDRLQQSCIGDTKVSREQLNDAWARAAQLGSRDAQYEYALDPRLNVMLVGVDTSRWRAWRDAAPRYLQNLVDHGDARAALAMAAGSDQQDCISADNIPDDKDFCRNGSGIAMILPQDPATAYTYYFLAQLLGGNFDASWLASELERIGNQLSPAEIAAAQAQARQRFAQSHPVH
jgi:hypothetical protein